MVIHCPLGRSGPFAHYVIWKVIQLVWTLDFCRFAMIHKVIPVLKDEDCTKRHRILFTNLRSERIDMDSRKHS